MTNRWWVAVGLIAAAGVAVAAQPGEPAEPPSEAPAAVDEAPPARTSVVLLGTGTPNADPDAHGPALAVVVDDRAYLVDAGPGVVRRAAEAYLAGVDALAVERLDRLFVTHLHSDHTLGLPDLMFSPWVLGRDHALRVVGPPGTEAMVEHLQGAYAADVANRLQGPEPANAEGHLAEVTEFEAGGEVYRDERVTVVAFPARHGSWDHAYGFRFSTPDLEVCVSGDTAPYPEMGEHYAGCDILVHEVYAEAGLSGRAEDWQAYHRASHTSGCELGEIAAEVQPGLLVLTHVLGWDAGPLTLLDEIAAAYDGQVVLGRDGTHVGVAAGFHGGRDGEREGAFTVLPLR